MSTVTRPGPLYKYEPFPIFDDPFVTGEIIKSKSNGRWKRVAVLGPRSGTIILFSHIITYIVIVWSGHCVLLFNGLLCTDCVLGNNVVATHAVPFGSPWAFVRPLLQILS
ncbi:hypothetical protein J6590_006482, partial [Homalodisca vitripennis]